MKIAGKYLHLVLQLFMAPSTSTAVLLRAGSLKLISSLDTWPNGFYGCCWKQVWDGYWMVSLTPIIPSSTLWIYFLFFILHLSMFLLLQGLKFHFWLLIENFLPFILASVAGYSLHLGNYEVVRMAWKRFLHNVCQGVLTISTICKLQSLIRFW